MKHIPIHYLSNEKFNFSIRKFYPKNAFESKAESDFHRDDHYVFFLIEEGEVDLHIDFEYQSFTNQQAFYILPGQIHTHINNQNAKGWYMALNTESINEKYRAVFESQLVLQKPIKLSISTFNDCQSILNIIENRNQDMQSSNFDNTVLKNLIEAFVGIIAKEYFGSDASSQKNNKGKVLTQKFRNLLLQQYKTLKSPTLYAEQLHVTENYLNEVIRKQTGFSVSYWIQHEVLLEAKRLLHYSSLDAKEIAFQLGYEDHTYFFKLFKKKVGLTPIQFRTKNTE